MPKTIKLDQISDTIHRKLQREIKKKTRREKQSEPADKIKNEEASSVKYKKLNELITEMERNRRKFSLQPFVTEATDILVRAISSYGSSGKINNLPTGVLENCLETMKMAETCYKNASAVLADYDAKLEQTKNGMRDLNLKLDRQAKTYNMVLERCNGGVGGHLYALSEISGSLFL